MRKFKINKKIVTIIIIILITITYLIIQNSVENSKIEENVFDSESVIEEKSNIIEAVDKEVIKETEDNIEQPVEEEKIFVHITGEVNNPGVVILNKGSRIIDAINSAGGTTNKANISQVNLVFILEDGMKVDIPSIDDLKKETDFEYVTKNSTDGEYDIVSGNDNNQSKTREILVNINTATQTELETLPGIGPSLALSIINYRNENGKFDSIEDIKNVSGIGESKFNKIKELISV